MALPTANQYKYGSVTSDDTNKVFRNVSQRFKNIGVSSSYTNKQAIDKFEKGKKQTATKDSTVGVLEDLYRFIVQDTFKKTKDRKLEEKRQDNVEKEQDEQQEQLMTAILEERPVVEEKKEESILSKLWRYFKYFQMGKFTYNHWEQIEKLLGIQGLGKTIKSISDDIGITGAFERIKLTIGDIIGGFGSGHAVEGLEISSSQKESMRSVYESAIEAGFSQNQARALTAQVGRETDFSGKYMFGSHMDPKNKQLNTGVFSWQGSRREELLKRLKSKNLIDPEGRIVAGKESLTEQFRFARGEMESGQYAGAETFLQKKDIGREESSQILGKEYIKWAYDNPEYSHHHAKERAYYESTGQFTTTPVTSDTSTKLEEPTRVPRSGAAENEKGETGFNASTKDIPSNDSAIADDNDIRNLVFQRPEQRFILKILAKKLQELRNELGYQKFIILSGYRSKEYNDELRKRHRGVAKNSCHTARIAADIVVAPSSEVRVQFIRTASRLGFGGIGVYKTFIHLDLGKRRTWQTDYKPSQDIIDALNDHTNQTTPQKDYKPIPGTEYEDGETGANQMNEGYEEDTQRFDPIEDLNNYLQSGMDLMKKVSDTFTEGRLHDFKDKLENALDKVTEIPRRDMSAFNIDAPNIQRTVNQYIINTTKVTTPGNPVDDSPPTLRK